MHFPIAILGIAFRFPGDLHNEHTFWDALQNKRDLVVQIPNERWATDELRHSKRLEPGRSITFAAGILSGIDEFDADFFGISPREAVSLDPQQRLLLELSWESMENAGIAPASLAGSDCAVYVGLSSTDYGASRMNDLASTSAYSITGATTSLAANRISYVFDLHGPSLAVDTACSSSLVALHQACACLRAGEASTALAGGISLLLHPSSFIGFTKASMLSAEGRCKPFDAAGDGYVRAEGGAVLLLKPLHQAIADGDAIQAVILASGVNTDGARKTGGITMPSSEAQTELLRKVLAKSGLASGDIDFVEAHGTGTVVGDPIEALAIGTVYGKGRKTPLPIGSVKGNLGHLEPASGMAGLVKTILALKNHALPATLHFHTPNPHIDFSSLNLEVLSDCRPLEKEGKKPLNAGVNSFGFGGSNAHVILQEYLAPPVLEQAKPTVLPPLFLSGRSDAALNALAKRYAELLAHTPAQDFYDLAHSAAYGRQRLEKRLGLLAESPEQAAAILANYASGTSSEGLVVENALPQSGGVAFVYSGNGAQWLGMGRKLLAQSPRFAEIISQLEAMMRPLAGFSIQEELLTNDQPARMDDTVVGQPLLFALQVAITMLLRERGIMPDAVAGHSVGEVAAAWAAGALSLEEAVQVIVVRSVAQGSTLGMGTMAAVALSEDEVRTFLQERCGELEVTIAAVNSPNMVTLSGKREDLEYVRSHFTGNAALFRFLGLDYAFHSPCMDGLRAVLLEELKGLRPSLKYTTTFVSTVTANKANGRPLDAEYWWRNIREPVQFHAAISKLAELGCRVFVEIGPDAILQRYIRSCLARMEIKGRILSTLRKKNDGLARIEDTALRVHLLAEGADKGAFFPVKGKRVRLPNYPWQKERYWLRQTSESLYSLERRRVHPLLGWALQEAEASWENVLDPSVLPWLADHNVGGVIVFPGAAYAEMALAAARQWLPDKQPAFEELDIIAPMLFDGEHGRTLRFILNPHDGGFQIKSRHRLGADPWILHAVGRLLEAFHHPTEPLLGPVAGSAKTVTEETHYRLAAMLGLDYGPTFQGLAYSRVDGKRLEGQCKEQESEAFSADYTLHPAQLDLCFQALLDFFQAEIESGLNLAFLPVKIGRLVMHKAGTISGFRGHLRKQGRRSALADFELLGPDKELIASVTACRFRAAALRQADHAMPGIWRIVPHLAPHPAENLQSRLPGSEELALLCQECLANFSERRRKWFKETLPLLEALTLAFAYEAFRNRAEQEEGGLSQLVEASAGHTRWLARLLQREELLVCHESGWQMVDAQHLPSSADIWQSILQESPASLARLALLGRIGSHLPELLTGQVDSAELLRTLTRSPLLDTLANDPSSWGTREAIASILTRLAQQTPENQRLRILEITAHPSAHPRLLRDLLPEDRLDYVLVYTKEEVGQRGQAEYRNCANVTLGHIQYADWKLSLDRAQPQCFDLVILNHTLHQAFDPLAALAQSRKLLAPGGALLLVEQFPDWHTDFLQGLDQGWWREDAANSGRVPLSPLRPPETWQQALEEKDYEEIVRFTEPEAEDLAEGAYLLIAKRPQDETLVLPPTGQSTSWLLVVDEASMRLAAQVRARLEAEGQMVALAKGMGGVDLSGVAHVVCCLGWNHAPEDAPELLSQVLADVQQLGSRAPKSPRLWIITRGGALVDDPPPSWATQATQSALWGFGRVVMNEYPDLTCTLIDLACTPDTATLPARLENELLRPDGSNEIILSEVGRHTLSLEEEKAMRAAACTSGSRFRLDFRIPGQLRNLLWLPEEKKPLTDGLVEVQTKATGLNFRDIMFLMGLVPEEAVESGFAGASLGLEFSGIVTRVGAAVGTIHPGDAVMGFGPSCFASHVVTRADALIPIPEGWSFESAATVPTVFFTAYYALKHLANLQPGESVLIHGGAGGVGIAAIQLARHLGATIFATAGSEIKRDFVRLLGADHVLDSRSLAFEEQIMVLTKGKGVDVVLNSLAGEAVRRNLHVLQPFGRFLELGKRDFVENTSIGLRPFKNNISYFGIDVDQLLIARPQLAAQLLAEVMELFRQEVLTPLPWQSFPATQVEAAFRCMQQAHHIGKIVVSMADARPAILHPNPEQAIAHFEPSFTWLISGGLSGFGLATARWLAAHGVDHLVLLGRRGTQAQEAVLAAEELGSQGVKVRILACDVSDKAALAAVIEDIRATMPPLQGLVHAAMVMDDGLIANMDSQSIQAVLRPKLLGAWHLHRMTLDLPLAHFVLFSSITTAIGNPGQANYVAANAGLEGLAAMRRQMGLPASCLNWGPLGDVGYLTRNTAVRDNLSQRLGAEPLTAAQALDQLGAILAQGEGTRAVARLDWNTLARYLPSADSPRFAVLNRKRGHGLASETTMDIRELFVGKTRDENIALVRDLIVDEVAQILCLSAERIDPNRSLHDLGMDSLMAVELSLTIEKRFAVQFPVMVLNEAPSIEKVSVRIVDTVLHCEDNVEDDTLAVMAGDLAQQHGEDKDVGHILHKSFVDASHEERQEG